MEQISKLKSKVVSLLGGQMPKRLKDSTYQDFVEDEWETLRLVKPFTMTSPERIVSLLRATDYIVKNGIEGDIVECGVWKGGSIMAILRKLKSLGSIDKKIWLCDTFEGMSEPTELDKDPDGRLASERMKKEDRYTANVWAYSSLEEVKENVSQIGYPQANVNFLQGKVEVTLPHNEIGDISLLRLDTDWYESTKIELELLYPKVRSGGIIIIDDYGHWDGCKKAVDEFIRNSKTPIFLSRIDYTGRLFVKP